MPSYKNEMDNEALFKFEDASGGRAYFMHDHRHTGRRATREMVARDISQYKLGYPDHDEIVDRFIAMGNTYGIIAHQVPVLKFKLLLAISATNMAEIIDVYSDRLAHDPTMQSRVAELTMRQGDSLTRIPDILKAAADLLEAKAMQAHLMWMIDCVEEKGPAGLAQVKARSSLILETLSSKYHEDIHSTLLDLEDITSDR